ncbi:hypothetical protein HNY42_03035 [Exiguobacterium sp. Helios]|uniref:hypothetical protein n=1 Tax=Exiguobacterium sp. Helios TaxID=2735868 RepID=UPI00165D6384|nr:hypothetical protein [Exiguobacterium sp. Helios]QNR19961.1 hypothetical protein HNY42_03035 [Exiguobacterium sp. Helios]
MHHSLNEFESDRYGWALDAKEEFLNHFSMYTVGIESGKGGTSTVLSVYGPTQVGKTTLILNLLGVKPESIDLLSSCLRGDRKIGNSSTSTVTRYTVSTDDRFSLTLPEEDRRDFETPFQLQEHITSLRLRMEHGKINPVTPVLIEFPACFFANPESIIDIVDLPGIESSDERESLHVQACVEYWIPRSHACLIVNSASDLTFLRDLKILQLKRWYEYPDNFYVVLTRAYSPDSIKRRIANGTFKNIEGLREYYVDEIASIVGHASTSIFPIEVGQSHNRLDDAAKELANQSLAMLKESIVRMDFRYLSFSFLTHYYTDVVQRSEQEISVLQEEVKNISDRLVSESRRIDSLEMRRIDQARDFHLQIDELEWATRKISDLIAQISHVNVLRNHIRPILKNIYVSRSRDVLNESFRKLCNDIHELITESLEQMNRIIKGCKNVVLTNLEIDRFDENPYLNFDEIHDDSTFDWYLSQQNYENQLNHMKDLLMAIVEDFGKEIDRKFKTIEEQITRHKIELIEEKHRLEQRKELRVTKFLNDKKRKEDDLFLLQRQLEDYEKLWHRDIEHAKRYRSFFIKHLMIRRRNLMEQAISSNPVTRYIAGLSLYTLESDARQIIDTLETGHGTD